MLEVIMQKSIKPFSSYPEQEIQRAVKAIYDEEGLKIYEISDTELEIKVMYFLENEKRQRKR